MPTVVRGTESRDVNVGGVYAVLARNPLWLREWRASARLARTPWLMAVALAALAGLSALAVVSSGDRAPDALANELFHLVFGVLTVFAALFGPAVAANSIALERDGKTWEPLLMAGLTAREIDRGKFLSAYTHLCLYLVALLPAAAVPHLFGTLPLTRTFAAVLMLFAVGALSTRFGLLLSAALPTARLALLVTIGGAALGCMFLPVIGLGLASWLSYQTGLLSDSNSIVFWPVALTSAPVSFDHLRYLLVIPAGLFGVSWVWLRELTVAALGADATGKNRLLGTFAILTPTLAVVLGLAPFASYGELLLVLCGFAVYLFFATVLLAGTKGGSRTSLRASMLLLAIGIAGFFLLPVITLVVSAAGPGYGDFLERSVARMMLYAPAFFTFVVGLAAAARAAIARPLVARATIVASTALVSLVPVLGAVLIGTESLPGRALLGLSPLAIVTNAKLDEVVFACAGGWVALGLLLLAFAHRREQRRAV